MSTHDTIRVRFAPSPTGYLHVGGLRTALYNYLFARRGGGVFVLRIEDTDRSRFVEGAVANLLETLRWAGLEFDEGPGKGGDCGPYLQSERLAIYAEHAATLLRSGAAYRCFCGPERLEQLRKEQEKGRLQPKYDRHCLALSAVEIEANLRAGAPHVVRMKIPDGTTVSFEDVVRNVVEFSSDLLDDQVLMKSDGFPTYHFANVVDDHLMKITHVIRGEEWLSSTPKHVLLYRSFGWEPPVFAHLPLLLNTDRSKLSKRQGDVAVEEFRLKGYLPAALLNFVSLLGWNPGTEQEVFTLAELTSQFSLERVNKAGAIFNLEKLNWLNFEHLKRMPDRDLLNALRELLARSPFQERTFTDAYLLRVIGAMRERISFIGDLLDKGSYFFGPPAEYDVVAVKKRWGNETRAQLERLAEEFAALDREEKDDFERALHKAAASFGVDNAAFIHAVRLAVSGVGGGPGVYDILAILGKEECIRRIHNAIERLR